MEERGKPLSLEVKEEFLDGIEVSIKHAVEDGDVAGVLRQTDFLIAAADAGLIRNEEAVLAAVNPILDKINKKQCTEP